MTDWTDKKRGYSGDRGNLGSHVNPMSFNRKTRELLGNLFQTKDQRVTPDGNVMVKAFGKYEKFKFETVKKEEPTFDSEAIVLYTYHDDALFTTGGQELLSLITLGSDGYKTRVTIALNWWWYGGYPVKTLDPSYVAAVNWPTYYYVYGASWNYEKEVFLILVESTGGTYYKWYYHLCEMKMDGTYKVVAVYDTHSDWGTHPSNPGIDLFHSYSGIGSNNLLWLGFGDTYYYSSPIAVLELNQDYGYTDASGAKVSPTDASGNIVPLIIPKADATSYQNPTTYYPYLTWFTHDKIAILKDETNPDWSNRWGGAWTRACEAGKKIAILHDTDFGLNDGPFEIRVSNDTYVSAAGDSGYTPKGWVETNGNLIKTSDVGTTTYADYWVGLGWYDDSEDDLAILGSYRTVDSYGRSTVYVNIQYGTDADYWINFGKYYDCDSYSVEAINYFPSSPCLEVYYETRYVSLPDPSGIYSDVLFSPYPPEGNPLPYLCCAVCVAWFHIQPPPVDWREEYYDIRYSNKKYIVVGTDTTTTAEQRIFVIDESGAFKYNVPIGLIGDSTYLEEASLQKVIVKR